MRQPYASNRHDTVATQSGVSHNSTDSDADPTTELFPPVLLHWAELSKLHDPTAKRLPTAQMTVFVEITDNAIYYQYSNGVIFGVGNGLGGIRQHSNPVCAEQIWRKGDGTDGHCATRHPTALTGGWTNGDRRFAQTFQRALSRRIRLRALRKSTALCVKSRRRRVQSTPTRADPSAGK